MSTKQEPEALRLYDHREQITTLGLEDACGCASLSVQESTYDYSTADLTPEQLRQLAASALAWADYLEAT